MTARIGMWGASQSGKTTMLGALPIAAEQYHGDADWSVNPVNPASRSLMQRMQNYLLGRSFPPASIGADDLTWTINGSPRDHSLRPKEFLLHLLDVEGNAFNDQPEMRGDRSVAFAGTGSAEARRILIDHLTWCDGIIMLFDPIQEQDFGNTHETVNSMLATLFERVRAVGRLRNGRLPHFLTVCITKFDHPRVMSAALSENDLDELSLSDRPRVSKKLARAYFDALCGQHGGTAYIRDAIQAKFDPERVTYYGTSSVGFYVAPGSRFNPNDYLNVVPRAGGRLEVRGRVVPMNVLEPFLLMADAITKAGPHGPRPPRTGGQPGWAAR